MSLMTEDSELKEQKPKKTKNALSDTSPKPCIHSPDLEGRISPLRQTEAVGSRAEKPYLIWIDVVFQPRAERLYLPEPPFVVPFWYLLWILVRFMVRNPQKELQMGVQVYLFWILGPDSLPWDKRSETGGFTSLPSGSK